MEKQIGAAKSSRRRSVKTPAVGNVSETCLSGNDLHGINGPSNDLAKIATTAVSCQASAIQPVPRLALSYEQAAECLGTKPGTIDYLVRIGELVAVPLCGQKSLVIFCVDLVQFANKRRDAIVKGIKVTTTCVDQ